MRRVFLGTLAAILVSGTSLPAQYRGQYILGTAGLNAGTQTPPGFTTAATYMYYEADAAKDADGQNLPLDGRYVASGAELLLAYTTGWRIFGATYGASIVMFWLDGSLTLERFGGSAGASGFADTYFEPLNLGWHLRAADLKLAYGLVAPTGVDEVTADYLGHDITLGTTIFLDEQRSSQLSLHSVTELHQKMRSGDFRVGDNTSLEFAAGRAIPLNQGVQVLELGVVGYGQWQFNDDSGADAVPALAEQQDRVFGLGAEVSVFVPSYRMSFLFRGVEEMAARSRAEGFILFAGIAKSF